MIYFFVGITIGLLIRHFLSRKEFSVKCPHCKGQGYIDNGQKFQGEKVILQCEICNGHGFHLGELQIKKLVEDLKCGCSHKIPAAEPERPTALEIVQIYQNNQEEIDKIWAKNSKFTIKDAVLTWLAIQAIKQNNS